MPVDLERALTAFADSLEFPGEATLAERVVAELSRAEPAPDHVVVPFWSRPAGRRVLAVAAAAIVLAGLVLVGSPRARRAVADLLGIGGIAIERSTSSTVGSSPESSPAVASTAPPTFPPGPDPAALAAGRPIGLDEGAAAGRRGHASPGRDRTTGGVVPRFPSVDRQADAGLATVELAAADRHPRGRCSAHRLQGRGGRGALPEVGRRWHDVRAGERRRRAGGVAVRRAPFVPVPGGRRQRRRRRR